MIVDRIENWGFYPLGKAWEKAFWFLNNLSMEAEEQYYWIDDKNIFARVMSYDTILPEVAKIEAHKKYIDIQMPLTEAEGIGWFPVDSLRDKSEYNEEKDVYFLTPPSSYLSKIDLYPGMFGFFTPKDAHMPKLIVESESKNIKKVVVKIKVDLMPSLNLGI